MATGAGGRRRTGSEGKGIDKVACSMGFCGWREFFYAGV